MRGLGRAAHRVRRWSSCTSSTARRGTAVGEDHSGAIGFDAQEKLLDKLSEEDEAAQPRGP
jgi:hypothetical protein